MYISTYVYTSVILASYCFSYLRVCQLAIVFHGIMNSAELSTVLNVTVQLF